MGVGRYFAQRDIAWRETAKLAPELRLIGNNTTIHGKTKVGGQNSQEVVANRAKEQLILYYRRGLQIS